MVITIIIKNPIENLEDLINLIENNPYDLRYQYSIDLKTLHIIKSDLINLNNMIGLNSLKCNVSN